MKRFLKKTTTKVAALVLILLFFLCLFIFWGWFVTQFNKLWGFYYVYEGDKFYRRAQLQKAINYYKIGLKKFPGHSKARCNLGNIYVTYEDYYSAVDEYEKALQYDPRYIVCRMNLGLVLSQKLADYDQAIQEFKTITNSRPLLFYIPFIYNNVSSVKTNKGRAYYNMGLAYRGKSLFMGEKTSISNNYLTKARESYLSALKILKKDYNTLYNLALVNHLLGNYKEAGLGYCKAIELKPLNYDAHYNLALLLMHLHMPKESLLELEKAGLILDTEGDANIARYVYDVLNQASQQVVNMGDYEYLAQRITTNSSEQDKVTFVNGKVVGSADLDRAILRNMKTCTAKGYFEKF